MLHDERKTPPKLLLNYFLEHQWTFFANLFWIKSTDFFATHFHGVFLLTPLLCRPRKSACLLTSVAGRSLLPVGGSADSEVACCSLHLGRGFNFRTYALALFCVRRQRERVVVNSEMLFSWFVTSIRAVLRQSQTTNLLSFLCSTLSEIRLNFLSFRIDWVSVNSTISSRLALYMAHCFTFL